MTITITANDVNGDGTGVNVASYLSNFESTFVPVGRGQFSGADRISGAEYASTDAAGYGVVLGASETDWSYSMTTHTVTGSLGEVSFGASTVLDTATRTFSQATDLKISGLGIEDNTLANTIRSTLTAASATSLVSALASDSLVFVGSEGADVFKAYDKNDVLSGGGGNDILWGYGGNDRLGGGAGNDSLVGGAGNDVILGEAGNDTLKGGLDNDTLKGSIGNDKLYGEAGDDKLYGDAGNDILVGAAGNDRLFAGAGNNTLTGGLGKDTFVFGREAVGRNVVNDFDAGVSVSDVLSLDKSVVASFADVKADAVETSVGVAIDYGAGSIVLKGVELADLARNDFFFA